MKREIKFRVWEKNKFFQWEDILYSSVLLRANTVDGIGDDMWVSFIGMALKNPSMTVQQFTGLKDTNNKEIYEGDIVKLDDNRTPHREVAWDTSLATYLFVSKDADDLIYKIEHWYEHCQVIGNIFENQELIEQ